MGDQSIHRYELHSARWAPITGKRGSASSPPQRSNLVKTWDENGNRFEICRYRSDQSELVRRRALNKNAGYQEQPDTQIVSHTKESNFILTLQHLLHPLNFFTIIRHSKSWPIFARFLRAIRWEISEIFSWIYQKISKLKNGLRVEILWRWNVVAFFILEESDRISPSASVGRVSSILFSPPFLHILFILFIYLPWGVLRCVGFSI